MKNDKKIFGEINQIFCSALACVAVIALAIVCAFTELSPIFASLAIVFFYLIAVIAFSTFHKNGESLASAKTLDNLFSGKLGDTMLEMNTPVLLCTKNGSIIWFNKAFEAIFEGQHISKGANVELWTDKKIEDFFIDEFTELSFANKMFSAYTLSVDAEDDEYIFIFFDNKTELEIYKKQILDDKIAIAIVSIDSFDEMSQYFQDNFTRVLADVDVKVTEWAEELDGIIKPYSKDKFIIVSNVKKMNEVAIGNSFEILNKVREKYVGDYIPLTISIGVSCIGDSLAEVLKYAQAALDTALQRGGDQAVLRHSEGFNFYGGKTKSIYKRSNVRATLAARELTSLVTRASNVLIMGHAFGDFDSFASCIGMARFCFMNGVTPHIIINKNDPNIAPCYEMMQDISEYRGVFIEASDGMEKIKNDTLLIVCDVNNFRNVEAPDILKNVRNIAIVDHHIKTSEYDKEPLLTYIEPSVSSASELVCEILQTRTTTSKMLKEEAELLLSGILLDTKQFTRNTGTRTFAAAQFLRSEGADPGKSNELFRESVDDIRKEAKFNSTIEIFDRNVNDGGTEKRARLAICYCEGVCDGSYRIAAAKAADKLLYSKDINAVFALVNIAGKIHISARSDGSINVQLILERLKGGGHFDVAGAQIEGKTMAGAMVMLKDAINDYFVSLSKHV